MYEGLIRRLRKLVADHRKQFGGATEESETISEAIDAIVERDTAFVQVQHEMMAEAESHIAQMQREGKPCWIRVKDRLPEEGSFVLVYGKELYPNKISGTMTVSRLFDLTYWAGFGRTGRITHWMKLPDVPEDDE